MRSISNSTTLILPLIFSSVSLVLSFSFKLGLGKEILEDGTHDLIPNIEMVHQSLPPKEGSSRTLVPSKIKLIQDRIPTTHHEIQSLEIPLELESVKLKSSGEYNWKIYYNKAPKVLLSNGQIPMFVDLAKAVIELGYHFSSKSYNSKEIEEKIIPCVKLAHRVLQLDSLGNRERIWVVGVLSCLKCEIPWEKDGMMSQVFGYYHLTDFKGELELFLLKDLPLGILIERMWTKNESLAKLDSLSSDVSEALKRASIANSALEQIITCAPHTVIQEILDCFIHLETPIDDSSASNLIANITAQLNWLRKSTWYSNLHDEERVMIRFLLHLQENHLPTRLNYPSFVKDFNIIDKAIEVDIDLQLQDKSTSETTKTVYRLLKEIHKINIVDLQLALLEMMNEKTKLYQIGRLLRILEILNMRNSFIYYGLDALLSQSDRIIWKFRNTLKYYYPGSESSDCFQPNGIMALIIRRANRLSTQK
ncbi:hypothetical protein DFH28DRAFT_879445 [Melampsora americana]|nr:hypothetical protein DFH28DRAFT_879445 [Melampsora americana]